MIADTERWERDRLLEALDSYKRGLSDAPQLRKWCSVPWENAHLSGPSQTRNARLAVSPQESPHSTDREGTSGRDQMAFVVSTEEVDRHGDVVLVKGWQLQAYQRNPVFLWAHDYTQPAIGRATDMWREDHSLLARMEFAPTDFAREVATLYQGGYQRGVSVGFRPLQYEMRTDTRTGEVLGIIFTEQELLEVSAAPVPANQSALRKALHGAPLMRSYYHHLGLGEHSALDGEYGRTSFPGIGSRVGAGDPYVDTGSGETVPWQRAFEEILETLQHARQNSSALDHGGSTWTGLR